MSFACWDSNFQCGVSEFALESFWGIWKMPVLAQTANHCPWVLGGEFFAFPEVSAL